jgi:biopolymer transport protein ExbD
MDAQLPVPCAAGCEGGGQSIMLEVLGSGGYLLNQRPVSAMQLDAVLHGVFDGRPEKIIQVAGHRRAKYQDVLTAMDAARSAGVRVISIPPSEAYLAK